jgi:TatD DNase family protein
VIELFDTHAHLQEPEFKDDAEAVIERARAAGVSTIVVPAVDNDTLGPALGLARRYDGIYVTAGYHPHEAARLVDVELDALEDWLDDPKVVAVGEIGLDFYRLHSPRDAQVEVFDIMLSLAERHAMPVVVHCRDAWEALAEQLVPWAGRVAPGFEGQPLGALHYFTGTAEEARFYAGKGFLISLHTSVTHPKAVALRDVAACVPLESLIIETDSPYGAPQAYRGQRNEPAFVVEAAKQIAEVKRVSLQEVAHATTANARRLFRLPIPAGTHV